MKRVPELCTYCRNFPCIEDDQEATVTTELKNSYPFFSENDALKPCEGENFVAVSFFDPEEEVQAKPEAAKPAPVQPMIDVAKEVEKQLARQAPKKQKRSTVVRGKDAQDLQEKIMQITRSFELEHNVTACTSIFDPESAKMNVIAVVETFEPKINFEDITEKG